MKYVLVFLLCIISSATAIGKVNIEEIRLKSESEKECLLTVMLGEISNGTDYEQRSFLWFFHFRESTHKMGYCSEFFSYKHGGARKYSSSDTRSLLRISQEKLDKQTYRKAKKNVEAFLSGSIRPDETQRALKKMTNVFAARKWGTLSWHKKHLIKKIQIGKTVYSQHRWS